MHKNHPDSDQPAELESQFILRLPDQPAQIIREAIRGGSTLKDRINIKIENDMRHGEVRVDHFLLPARVMDLPTVLESLKSIDGKGFYKTADICQMLICKEEEDATTDEDSPQKAKKKDPNKVEKKYLMPHGITPPAKNVRKRRFRKTLKKKYVEAPEIEKEVKGLLRIDNDAVSVKWEVINEDDENKVNKGTVIKKEPLEAPNQSVAEHDIFGAPVSDSDEDDAHLNVLELDDATQNSGEEDNNTDSNSVMLNSGASKQLLTEFTSDMFMQEEMGYYHHHHHHQTTQPSMSQSSGFSETMSRSGILARLEELEAELTDLRGRRQQQELEVENIGNVALRQRFQDLLEQLLQAQYEKEQEKYSLEELLKHSQD